MLVLNALCILCTNFIVLLLFVFKDPSCSSFVGRISIPLQHGMTIGELGLYFHSTIENTNQHLAFDVVQMQGWDRGMSWEDTKLPW